MSPSSWAFPEHPIMPGVLIIEAYGPTAGCWFQRNEMNLRPAERYRLYYFVGTDKLRFRQPVSRRSTAT